MIPRTYIECGDHTHVGRYAENDYLMCICPHPTESMQLDDDHGEICMDCGAYFPLAI